ncbi:hypothetical protein [Spirosoma pulveris]
MNWLLRNLYRFFNGLQQPHTCNVTQIIDYQSQVPGFGEGFLSLHPYTG